VGDELTELKSDPAVVGGSGNQSCCIVSALFVVSSCHSPLPVSVDPRSALVVPLEEHVISYTQPLWLAIDFHASSHGSFSTHTMQLQMPMAPIPRLPVECD
jgi:hypothetical protein